MKSKITYERVMLTLIAGLLAANLLSGIRAPQPEDGVPAMFVSWREDVSHRFVMMPVNPDGSINVRVKETSLTEVSIKDISTSDKLQVAIDGELPVKIRDNVKVQITGTDWRALKDAGPIEVKAAP